MVQPLPHTLNTHSSPTSGVWHSSKVAVKFMVISPDSLKQAGRVRWSELMCKELSHPNLVQVRACAGIGGSGAV